MADGGAVAKGGDAPRRLRGRPKVAPDAERRDRIVEIGRGLFLERGFGRATMDEVAARGRISKTTLYRFFANKLDLFAAVVEAHRHSMLAFPDGLDELAVADALRVIVRVDIDAAEDRARHALLEMALFETVGHPELGEVIFRHGAERKIRAARVSSPRKSTFGTPAVCGGTDRCRWSQEIHIATIVGLNDRRPGSALRPVSASLPWPDLRSSGSPQPNHGMAEPEGFGPLKFAESRAHEAFPGWTITLKAHEIQRARFSGLDKSTY